MQVLGDVRFAIIRAGPHRYAYVLNNPLGFSDPFGLDCVYLNSSGTGVEKNGVDQKAATANVPRRTATG